MKVFIFFLCLIAFSFNSNAAPESYLHIDDFSFDQISPPIKVRGKRWVSEINHIISLQKNADEGEIQESAEEKNLRPELTAQFVVPELTRADFPETYKFLDNVAQSSRIITTNFKDHFGKKRPYIADKRVKALIDAHDNPAYPSGHTSGAYITAHALSLLFPNNKEEFFNRAEEIAQHRVLVGMHFPHDIQGGKQLAILMSKKLASNEDFLRDLKAAREEIASKSN